MRSRQWQQLVEWSVRYVLRCWAVSLLLCGLAASARADEDACIAAHEQAQVLLLRGRYVAAREQLLVCGQSNCPQLVRNDCFAQLGKVDAGTPSVIFVVADQAGQDLVDVQVWAEETLVTRQLDGRAIPMDPGVYTFRFSAAGYLEARVGVTLRETEKQRFVRVQLTTAPATAEPAPAKRAAAAPVEAPGTAREQNVGAARDQEPSPRLLLSSYVLGGTALATLGTGVALGVLGMEERDRVHAQCHAEGCAEADLRHGKNLYIGANVAFGVGGALAVAAVGLFVAGRKRKQHVAQVGASLFLIPCAHGAALGWSRPL